MTASFNYSTGLGTKQLNRKPIAFEKFHSSDALEYMAYLAAFNELMERIVLEEDNDDDEYYLSFEGYLTIVPEERGYDPQDDVDGEILDIQDAVWELESEASDAVYKLTCDEVYLLFQEDAQLALSNDLFGN